MPRRALGSARVGALRPQPDTALSDLLLMTTDDKRRGRRRRVLLGARITYRGRTSTDCTVRDLSDTGACLLVASPVGIPDTFDLVFADSAVKRCKLEWRKADKIGVSFA